MALPTEMTGARLPDLQTHVERQMRTQERQLAVARYAIAAAAIAALFAFRSQIESFSWLVGLAGAVVVYNTVLFLLLSRFPAREVGIVATALDMVVVTLGIYAQPGELDAYLFYWPVILGVALRFGLAASVWAAAVVSFMYGSVILLTTEAPAPVVRLLPVRIAYLLGIGLAAGLFARVVIARAAENARLQGRLDEEERERERAREREVLGQLAREFGTSLDRETTVQAILNAAAPLLGDLTWVLLVEEPDEDGQPARLATAQVAGRDEAQVARLREHLESRKPRVGEGLAGGAAATATALVANRAADLFAATGDPDGVAALRLRSLLAAPIVSRGSVRGVLASASIAGPLLGDGELRLAQAIAERAGPALENATLWADLQEQMRREQLAQRIKDDFLSIVSHELRTPLTSIQGYAQLLENRIRDAAASDKELGQVRVIRSQVARMRRLVDDLLDVSRIDRSGAVSVDPEPLDLAADLRDAASRSEREHPDRRLVLDSPDTLPMRADRDRIAQVLTNLLDNAIKYSPDGGEVRVTAAQHGELVSLTVADEGIGIPAEQRDLVFDRFFQADADTRGRRFGGLGLGLYITRAIVEAHGGRIWATANDAAARGTVMNVELPRVPPTGLRRPAGLEAGEPPPFVVRRRGSPS